MGIVSYNIQATIKFWITAIRNGVDQKICNSNIKRKRKIRTSNIQSS